MLHTLYIGRGAAELRPRWTEGIAEIHKDSGVLTPHEALVDLQMKYEII